MAKRERYGAFSISATRQWVLLIAALAGFEPAISRLEVEVSLFYDTTQKFIMRKSAYGLYIELLFTGVKRRNSNSQPSRGLRDALPKDDHTTSLIYTFIKQVKIYKSLLLYHSQPPRFRREPDLNRCT